MATRAIKDAKDLSTNELIYFKGHAKATYMSDGKTVEDAINQIGTGGGGVQFVNPELKMAEVNGFQDDSGTTYALPNSSINNTNEASLTIAIADVNFVIGEGMVDGDDNRFALPTNNAGLADNHVLATKQDVVNNKNLIYKANSATSGTLNLEANVCHHFPNPLNGTFTIQQPTNYSNNNAALVESRIVFTTGTTVPSIVFRFTAATRWANGVAPTFEANTTYEISLFFPADVNTKGPLGVCVGFKQYGL